MQLKKMKAKTKMKMIIKANDNAKKILNIIYKLLSFQLVEKRTGDTNVR